MTEEQLSALERECVDHFLRWLRGFTTAREMWYLIALEQEHFASKEALQMMQHVGKRVYCCIPSCNRDGFQLIAGKYYCRVHYEAALREVRA